MANSKATQKRHNLLLIAGGAILIIAGIAAFILLSPTYEKSLVKDEIKKTVREKINRNDFEVGNIIVESDGWQLADITSTRRSDKGNRALVIVHEENGKKVIKFGPGTRFAKNDLDNAGVPAAIQDKLFAK